MTTSASTPRIRVLQLWYLIVLFSVAVSGRHFFHGWSGTVMSLLGLLLMTVAALGRIWTSTFIAGYKDEQLVTAGPYSLCRHPLYALSLLGALGVGFATRSLGLTAATLLISSVLHLRAIRAEERNLSAMHGERFERYRRRVPKLWPSRAHYEAPETATVNLGIFRKAFLDAGAFILLYVLIQTLDALRGAGYWPTVFELW